MRKLIYLLLCALTCLSLSGCKISVSAADREFPRREYNDDEKIAGNDRYDDGDTYIIRSGGRYYGGYEEFEGRRTIAECPSEEDKSVSVELSLRTGKGKAKVVFVDAELNVTTLIEFEGGADGQMAKKATKNLVWTLPAVLLVNQFDGEVYVGIWDMFTARVNFLKYLPVFAAFTVYLLGGAILQKGSLVISKTFGFDKLIIVLFVGITEETVFRGWFLNAALGEKKNGLLLRRTR